MDMEVETKMSTCDNDSNVLDVGEGLLLCI